RHARRNDRKLSGPATGQSPCRNQAQAAATQATRHTVGQYAAASMIQAYIGLGANLGNTLASLQQAASELSATPGITGLRLSRFYRSTPVDASGPDYVNAVAEIQTSLSAADLLAALQAIENHHGRLRPYRNAPRTLDLDLLLYGDQIIDTPNLTVPHQRMHERAFVLRPLQELAPALELRQGRLPTLLQACSDQVLSVLPDPEHKP